MSEKKSERKRNTYIVSYDMANGGEYQELFDEIKSYGYWAHINNSTFAIRTTQTAFEIRDHLFSFMPSGSRLFVIKSGHFAAWSNVICSNEWLKNYL